MASEHTLVVSKSFLPMHPTLATKAFANVVADLLSADDGMFEAFGCKDMNDIYKMALQNPEAYTAGLKKWQEEEDMKDLMMMENVKLLEGWISACFTSKWRDDVNAFDKASLKAYREFIDGEVKFLEEAEKKAGIASGSEQKKRKSSA